MTQLKRFKKFYIEITNVCNLSCDFCKSHNRELGFMSLDEFSHILDQIKPYTDYIYLHVTGEPLLHPKLEELLRISKEKGFFVTITTNGTLLPKVGEILIESDAIRQLNISLHSMSQNECYVKKEDYIKNILEFSTRALKESKMILAYRFWNLNKDNEVNQEENINREYLKAIEKWFSLSYHIEDKVTEGNGIKLRDKVYLNQDPIFDWPDMNREIISHEGFCYGLRNQIGVLVDGSVIPCCLDGDGVVTLGNIFSEKFNDILVNERTINLYEGFSRGMVEESLCKRCGYRTRFDK